MKEKQYRHTFVDSIPITLQDDVIYVCIKHKIVAHMCACGCGHRIDTPLDPNEWKLSYNGESISLWPSIGNWDIPCRSHYFITNNKALFVKRKRSKWFFF